MSAPSKEFSPRTPVEKVTPRSRSKEEVVAEPTTPPINASIKSPDTKKHRIQKEYEIAQAEEAVRKSKAYEQIMKHLENQDKATPREQLLFISNLLINSEKGKYSEYEMEAKFGTKGIRPLTKMDYDNVVKKLLSMGFLTNAVNNTGSYTLKIQQETLDMKTGEFKTSADMDRFRVEIEDIHNIQEYCQTDDIKTLLKNKSHVVNIMKKNNVYINDKMIRSAEFNDFNFRVTYKTEETLDNRGKESRELVDKWNRSKKIFRYVNRVSFTKPGLPFRIDLSIVRSSSKDNRGRLIKTYNIQESNVFKNPETYEIEIEAWTGSARFKYNAPQELANDLENLVKIVLSGLQKTNYPISYKEQKLVGQEYMRLIHVGDEKRGGEYIPPEYLRNGDFIGPSSVSLQIKNIAPINPDMNIPNIRFPYSYCVTDKADGERHLLYINNSGKIYLINTNMNVIFTGAKTTNQSLFNSLIDGELITHDKNEKFINTYAAFDVYFINKEDVRSRPFVQIPTKDKKHFEKACRLPLLKELIKELNAVSILSKEIQEDPKKTNKVNDLLTKIARPSLSEIPILITCKNFYPIFAVDKEEGTQVEDSIFEACNYIIQRMNDNLYEYNTDGLIFTPTLYGVGGTKIGEAGPIKKITWEYSFKWKPAYFNTIDFLITTKKATDGTDIITPIFENGMNLHNTTQFNQYKTLVLRVGFDEKKHGFINPCQDLLDDKEFRPKDMDNEDTYVPMQFFPTDPYDPQAGLCNIMLEKDANDTYQMFTEEGQVFGDNTVVEFRYDKTKEGLWRWVPLRVRYDKTTDYRQGKRAFGNDYKTADSNWHSIHNEITDEMIATGKNIPTETVSDDVYYNVTTRERLTGGMRDFHNLYVKKLLIQSVSKRGASLIDYACGKGGDLPKWISSNLAFIFGIDVSKDNIENRLNGACARYLNYKKQFKTIPSCLFVHGNSSMNIRSGKAMFSDKAVSITKNVFGNTALDKQLGPVVEKNYGIGAEGFNVSSCQFAIHYMFENKTTFYNFIRNVAECTKLNGYFIGTSYDGKNVFNMLNRHPQGYSHEIYTNDKKVWSVRKDYDATEFNNNDSCLGYKISVYQDSINQIVPEFLVNYDFLTSELEKYGFELVKRDEAKSLGLPEGSGMFVELYNMMMNNVKKNPSAENDYGDATKMTSYEREISFLNRYFVYKKTHTYNVEKLTKAILEQLPDEYEFEERKTVETKKVVKEAEKEIKPKVKNLRKKIMLQETTEAVEEKKEKKELKKRSLQNIGLQEPKDDYLALEEGEDLYYIDENLEDMRTILLLEKDPLIQKIYNGLTEAEKEELQGLGGLKYKWMKLRQMARDAKEKEAKEENIEEEIEIEIEAPIKPKKISRKKKSD